MQKCHPQLYPAYITHKDKCKADAEKTKIANRDFTPHDRIAKRPRLIQCTIRQSVDNMKPATQKEAEELMVDYIVNSLSPICHVEHPSFIGLVRGLAPHVNVCSRRTVSRRIDDRQKLMVTKLKEVIMQADYICITADAWSGFHNRRSFLGITCHILDTDLQRRSFALACRLFPGSHTYDRIAALMSDILKEYGIPVEKITCCVTDNGSNFVKAFKEFQVEVATDEQSDDEELGDDENQTDVVRIDLCDLITEASACNQSDEQLHMDDEADDPIVLPAHQRCASHTLNLVGCNGPPSAAGKNVKYRSLMHASNAKLSAIWNKVNSPKSNEIILSVLDCQVMTPVPTRWNSYYDARRSLLLHSSDKINELCVALGLPVFKDVEFAFMKEEMQVLTPLAQGLDRLQGHSNPESYMAFLFPTLMQLRHVYREFSSNRGQGQALKYCSPLASVILQDISTRFREYFEFSQSSEAAILASITHPAFKLRWLPTDVVDQMKSLFLGTLKDTSAAQLQQSLDKSSKASYVLDSNTLDFFTFMHTEDSVTATNTQSHVELQGLQYLEDTDQTLSSLCRYPLICQMFRYVFELLQKVRYCCLQINQASCT